MPDYPPLPTFPGLTFRRYHGPDDVPGMLAVHATCRGRDRLDPHSVCYRLPFFSADRSAQEITLPDATLIARHGDTIVAHAFLEAWGSDERLHLWRVWVRPAWRGQGLGTQMHRWGEAYARALHGADLRPALHLANATEGEADAVDLLQNEGYHLSFVSPELAFDLAGDLPAPVVPTPVILRPLDAASAPRVARALCLANLTPPGHGSLTPDELEQRLTGGADEWNAQVRESAPSLSVVAWDRAEVAGAYLCRRVGDVGDIAQVAVREEWRGRGIARALAHQSLRNLRAAGCVTARLFTSTAPDDLEPPHGPYAMYRKFGFHPIARHLRFRKPMALGSRGGSLA